MAKRQKIKKEELYDVSKDKDVKQHQEEAKQRWGDTDAFKQSMAKIGKMTKAKIEKMKTDSELLIKKLAASIDKDVKSKEVQELIAEHYKGIQFFYDCPLSMYRNLGEMYVNDPRFTAHYDKYRPGLAVFIHDAIVRFCDMNKNEK
jgi:hypothetical protein